MAVPYTFANATGNIALSELDANFANVSQNSNRANTAGTVTTAAQPNITSVGTLTTLSVSGNITGGNIISTFYGSGIGLTTIPGANVLGAVPVATTAVSANSATVAGTATTATTAGTVTTAAQPNITSVGTLSSLSVTGNITSTTGNFVGNGAGLVSILAANISGTVANATYATSAGSADSANTAGTVTTAAQPNITSLGTLSSLDLTGNVSTTGNVSFGFNGNGLLYTDSVSSVLTSKNLNNGAFLGTGSGNIIVGASPFVGVLMVTDFNASNRAITWNNGTLDLDGIGSSILGNITNVNNITTSGTLTSPTIVTNNISSDDSTYVTVQDGLNVVGDVDAINITVTTIKTTPVTLVELPSAVTAGAGTRAFITDADSVTFGNLAVGGAGNNMPVFSNGTSWLIG